jgi:hypothetical protein
MSKNGPKKGLHPLGVKQKIYKILTSGSLAAAVQGPVKK